MLDGRGDRSRCGLIHKEANALQHVVKVLSVLYYPVH